MFTHTIDMAIKELYDNSIISSSRQYNKGAYFTLSSNGKKLVKEKVEYICITTRLLSLASNKKLPRQRGE